MVCYNETVAKMKDMYQFRKHLARKGVQESLLDYTLFCNPMKTQD